MATGSHNLKQELFHELRRTSILIDKQIAEMRAKAKSFGIEPERMQNPDGSYSLTPLLLAKATVLNALVLMATDKL